MTELPLDTILDAARDQFLRTGVRRTSGDDIARRAGINRATLYRRVGPKAEVVRATYRRETEWSLARIEAALGDVPTDDPNFDAADYAARFFAITITELRENALLQQLLDVDRDETLRGLTLEAGETIALASLLVRDRLGKLRALVGNPATEDLDDLAAMLTRLAQSLVLTRDAPPHLDTREQMDQFARRVIVPLVLGTAD